MEMPQVKLPDQKMLIDGELVDAVDARTYDNLNPATEETLGSVPDAGALDVERALAAARRSFDEGRWANDVGFRQECIRQLQNQLRKDIDRIRAAHTAETGMPVMLALGIGVDGPIESLSYYADLIGDFEWSRELPSKHIIVGPARRRIRKEPAGVVSAITPWNFPFQLNLTKIGATLAAGCSVVLKPAPDTPWSGTLLAAAVAETDIPAGVLNIVTTSDNTVAELMTTHPDVDHITFTGSTATGRRIMRNAAETIKRISLELGGKSAMIVLDAPMLEAAVGMAVGHACSHGGQGCACLTRLLVPNSLLERANEIAQAVADQIPYGDPTDPNNIMGPLINKTQYDKVLSYMEIGRREGTLLTGGGAATQFEKGYFVQPTVITRVDNSSTIAQQEIFGPVSVIIGFDDDDDAIQIANDTQYGLSGAVVCSDLERAGAVANQLRTGTVGVNLAQWFDPESPFGGYHQSGIGREGGPEGLEEFLETKTVSYPG